MKALSKLRPHIFSRSAKSFSSLIENETPREDKIFQNFLTKNFKQRCLDLEKNVTIKRTLQKGRGIYAKRRFSPSEIVFNDSPLVSIPKKKEDYCNNCLQVLTPSTIRLPSSNLVFASSPELVPLLLKNPKVKKVNELAVKCNSCKNIVFCSEECATEASNTFHKHLCPANLAGQTSSSNELINHALHSLEHSFELSLQAKHKERIRDFDIQGNINKLVRLDEEEGIHGDPILLLIIRIYSIVIQELNQGIAYWNSSQEGKKVLSGGTWEFLNYLDSKEFEEEFMDGNANIHEQLQLVKNCFSSEDVSLLQPILSEEHLTNLKAVCYNNIANVKVQMETFYKNSLSEKSKSPIVVKSDIYVHGVMIPFLSALINHSCDPSVYVSHSHFNHQMEWIANRVIEEGEEVTVSYIPSNYDVNQRRKLLQNWGFQCQCTRCVKESKEI